MRDFSLHEACDGGDQETAPAPETPGTDDGRAAVASPTPHRNRDTAAWWITALGVVLIALIAFGTAALVSDFRERARADARHALNTTAYIIAEHCEGTFQSVELVQRNVIERVQSFGIASSDDLERLMSGVDTHLMLKDMVSGVPQLDALTLISASGKRINSSREWPLVQSVASEREYLRALTSNSKLTLFLSEPGRSRRTGAWTTYLARRLVGPNGEFIGIIVGLMELRHFEEFFGSVSIGMDVDIALFRSDGLLLARDPHIEAAIGQKGDPNVLFHDIWSATDAGDQLSSLQALTHYPVVVSVSTTTSAALAQWHNEAKIIIGAVGLAALSIGAFVALIVRKMGQGIRQSRQRLRGQKLQLDTALNNMSQGLLMCDADDRVVLCNRRYMEIYAVSPEMVARGCTRQELIAHHFEIGLLAGSAEEHMAAFTRRATLMKSYTRTVETTDGRTIFVSNRPIEGGFRVSTHEDITERRRVERERDRNRDFLDRIIDNIPVTVFVKDAHSLRYLLINRAGERLWGLPRALLVGKTPHEIFDQETADTIVEHDRQLLESHPELFVPEHSINTPRNGVRLVKSNRICIRDQNGEVQYLLGVTEDVTERKGVEDQLRQAQKMEAVGNLTGGVAHDFNNLLTVIIGNLDLMRDDIVGNEAAEHKIDTILQAAERGSDLTRLMLAFSRRQPLQSKPVDVNRLIRSTTRLLSRTLGEDISIELHPETGLAQALVDEAQLETALLNIAINARDAMPEGGMLSITTRNAELDADYTALHPGVDPGAYVQIEVADTGVGMPPDVVERVFEPFFTTKAVGKGTGLGLSMVYGFMKQSNGHVSVYSEVGQGTVFKLFLPVSPGAEVQARLPEPAAEQPARHSGDAVILAVDDNPDVRATVVVQLEGLGYRVREADNAHSALEILDSVDRIDLLFTDIIMPGGLNGKELATKARSKRPDLKVLFTSGFPGTSAGPGTRFDDGDVLLSKPYRKHDLAKAVKEILAPRP
jgi:PAS domain S-box-containing protein